MSGTQTPITISSSLFRDYGTSPATVTDLGSLISQTETAAANALASSTSAASAAASASASATAASSAISTAVASVNTAVTNAQTTITASANTATTAIGASTSAAATSATNAATSATNAATSATAAATSATAAASSASAASTSATMASGSATAAATSATGAATSATAASSSASAASTSATSAASAVTAISNSPTFRNALINGAMTLWQRGTSLTPGPGVNYTADMVQSSYDGSGGTTTISQVAVTDATVLAAGHNYALSYVVTGSPSGGTYRTIQMLVEGPRTLAGKTVRMTCWIKADSLRSVTLKASVAPGTGGSPAGGYTSSAFTTTTVNTSWIQVTGTATFNAASTITPGTNSDGYVLAIISLPINTAMSFQMTGVQLEQDKGLTTAFDLRPAAIELTLAQRYYQTGAFDFLGYQAATYLFGSTVTLTTTMRATPTVSSIFSTSTNATSPTVLGYTPSSVVPYASATATGAVYLIGTFTASASL